MIYYIGFENEEHVSNVTPDNFNVSSYQTFAEFDSKLVPGDLIYAYSILDFNMTARKFIDNVVDLYHKGVYIICEVEKLDTRTNSDNVLLFEALSSCDTLVRSSNIKATLVNVKDKGRKKILSSAEVKKMYFIYATKGLSYNKLAELFNISSSSVSNYINTYKQSLTNVSTDGLEGQVDLFTID